MKAIKNILGLAAVLLVLIHISAIGQEKEFTWDYPVKPGAEEWRQFKSMKEMYQACQIPDNIMKQLDTESLVNICLNFPAPPVFLLYNTPQQAFMEYYNNFNGIQELFVRKDAGHYLLNKYAKMSLSEFNPLCPLHKQGQFTAHYKFVEAILSQPQVIASLDAEERKVLLREALSKIDEKISKKDLFSGFSLEINLWVIGQVLYSENRSSLQEFNQKNFQTSMNTGMFVDVDVDMLYQLAKNYAYENK